MNRIVSVTLLIGGLVFMIAGINRTNTRETQDNDKWLLTGKPTNKARLMLFGGAGAAIVGLTMSFRGRKKA